MMSSHVRAPARSAGRARRRRRLLGAAGVLLLASVLVAGPPTLRFVREAFPAIATPVAEFDEGSLVRIDPAGDETEYVVCMSVGDIDALLPALHVTARTAEGDPVETTPANGWMTVMGRDYRRFLDIRAASDAAIELAVDVTEPGHTEGAGHFAVFRHPDAVLSHHAEIAMPWWIGGGVALLAAVALVFVAVASRIADPSDIGLD